MTKKELQEFLEDFDDNLPIVILNSDNEYVELEFEHISEEEILKEDYSFYYEDYDECGEVIVLLMDIYKN